MRLTTAARLTYGMALLIAPGHVSQALTGAPLDHRARVVARVLALREIGQALVVVTMPSAAVRQVGASVDAAHAVSMLALAAVSPGRRRVALASAAIAALLSVAGWDADAAASRRAGLPWHRRRTATTHA